MIEDAACAIGSEIRWDGRWERIGRPHGDIACFSFHPRKLLSTGDGGMLTTRDAELDATFRLLRQHGMSVPDTVRHASSQVVFESTRSLGFNYRMTDIQAAIGREQLKRLPAIVARRRDAGRRDTPTYAARHSRCRFRRRAGMGAHQLAELHRPPAPPLDQRRVMQRMLDDGHVDAPRCDERASRAARIRRDVARRRVARRAVSRRRTRRSCCRSTTR